MSLYFLLFSFFFDELADPLYWTTLLTSGRRWPEMLLSFYFQLSLSLFCAFISLSFSHTLSLPVDPLSSSCRSVCCPHFTPHFQLPPSSTDLFPLYVTCRRCRCASSLPGSRLCPFSPPCLSSLLLGQISLNLLFSPHLFPFLSLTLSCAGSDSKPLVHLHLLFISFFLSSLPPSIVLLQRSLKQPLCCLMTWIGSDCWEEIDP